MTHKNLFKEATLDILFKRKDIAIPMWMALLLIFVPKIAGWTFWKTTMIIGFVMLFIVLLYAIKRAFD